MASLIDIIGIWTENEERKAGIKNDARVAKFNRQVDKLTLASFIERMKDDQSLSRQVAVTQRRHATTAWNERALSLWQRSVARQHGAQQANEILWRSEADYAAAIADVGVAVARRQTQGAVGRAREATLAQLDREGEGQVARASWVVQAERRLHSTQMSGIYTRRNAGRRLTGATERHLQAQEAAIGATSEKDRTAVAAGMGRIGAERQALSTVFGAKRAERVEEAYATAGAAYAGDAARGVRGSGAQAETAQEVTKLTRDLAVQDADRMVQSFALFEREARLGAEAAEIGGKEGVERARIGQAQARLNLDHLSREVGSAEAGRQVDVASAQSGQRRHLAGGRYRVGKLERGEERARLGGERAERSALRTREAAGRQQAHAQRMMGGGASSRMRTTSEIQARTHGLAAGRARTAAEEATTAAWKTDREGYHALAGQRIAEWKLNQMPSLPNYEQMQTRSAIRSILDLFG